MGTKTYSRIKDPSTNSTGMDLSYQGSELPTAKAALVAGASGDAQIHIEVDADESAGTDVQDAWTVKLIPTISPAMPGTMGLTIEVTPVLGDASDGTKLTYQAAHEETMDAWQAAAGRAQQP